MKKHINFIIIFLLFIMSTGWAQNNYQNITTSIKVCNQSTITSNFVSFPIGPGSNDDLTEDIAKGCLDGESNSLWIEVKLNTSGQFGFDIIPSGSEDYDFAVYGPVDSPSQLLDSKGDIGIAPLRCSFAPTSNKVTSVGNDTDTSEGVSGNGIVQWIDGIVNKSYFILINKKSTLDGEIKFELTKPTNSSVDFDCENAICPILPDFETSICNNSLELDATPTNLSSDVQIEYSWVLNGDLFSNASSIAATTPGQYTVTVTANFCTVTQNITVTDDSFTTQNTLYQECPTTVGGNEAEFNLDSIKGIISSNTSASINFYESEFDAENETNKITNPSSYTSASKSIYANINNNKCFYIVKIDLEVTNQIDISGQQIYTYCNSASPPILSVETTGTKVYWYIGDVDGTPDFIGSPNDTFQSTGPGIYNVVSESSSGCQSDPFTITVNNNTPITITSNGDKTYCPNAALPFNGTPIISVTTNAQTVKWYDNSINGTELGEGLNFQPSQNGSYWAEAITPSCTSPNRVEVKVSLSSDTPSIELLTPNEYSHCKGNSLPTFSVSSNSTDIKWYKNSVNKNNIVSTSPNFTLTSDNIRLYYVVAYNPTDESCSSIPIPIRFTTLQKNEISGQASYAVCNGVNPDLRASPKIQASTIRWYKKDEPDTILHEGRTWSNVPIGEYYAVAEDDTNSSCNSDPLYVTVKEDQSPSTIPDQNILYCPEDGLELTIPVDEEDNTFINWYDAETEGNLIGTGNPLVITNPEITEGEYWAEVRSNFYCMQPARVKVTYQPEKGTPTLTVPDIHGFCVEENQTIETITVISSATDDNILWYLDKDKNTPYTQNGIQVTGKNIEVTEARSYWVQAIGTTGCNSALIEVPVLNYNNPTLSNPPTSVSSCGNNDVIMPTLTTANPNVDLTDPSKIKWYSDENTTDLIGEGNDFEVSSDYIGQSIYVQIENRVGCFSKVYPIEIIYNDIPTIDYAVDPNQSYCEDINPNPLGATTNNDNFEIIWYNIDGIERGRTKNGETINPDPEDYINNTVTTYYAQAVNPQSTGECLSPRIEFTFTKIQPPILSSDITDYNYCQNSDYDEIQVTVSNDGNENFVKWYRASNTTIPNPSDTEVGTGLKLIIKDSKNNINLGEGNYYAITTSDGKNCASNAVSIEVNELDLSDTTITTPNTILFEGDTLEFSTTNPTDIETYLWTGPNDFSSDLANPIIENVTLDHTGQYNVLMSNKCESKTNSIDILVLENVETALGENIVFCKNDTDTIDPVTKDLSNKYPQDYIFQWYGPNGFSSNEKTITISEVGRYVLTVTSPEGNSSTGSLAVLFSTLDLQNENIKTCYNQTLLQPIGGTQPYQYALDNGSWQSSPIFTNITQGFHTYKVQDANGCVIETSGEYYTPFVLRKAFTPNGDGYNDIWDLSALQGCTNLDVKIFDRYGRYLYQIKTNNLKWDGNINGKPLPNGTYWYVMEFNDGATPILKGHITIRRTKD